MRVHVELWGRHSSSWPPSLLEDESLAALQGEVGNGRRKFPGNRLLLAGLVEEVGELAKALLQREGRASIEREALQVAAVAMRIYEEGDATFADVSDEEAQP
jgi:hypothetical protein